MGLGIAGPSGGEDGCRPILQVRRKAWGDRQPSLRREYCTEARAVSRARLDPSAVLNHECTLADFASGPQMFSEHLPAS